MNAKRKRRIILITVIVLIIGIVGIVLSPPFQLYRKRQALENEIQKAFEKRESFLRINNIIRDTNNIETIDRKIVIDKELKKDIEIYSENFSELKDADKKALCLAISAAIPDELPISFKIISNNDVYTYKFWLIDIGHTQEYLYKNGELVYIEEDDGSKDSKFNFNDYNKETSDLTSSEKGYAWTVAQTEVKKKLKSPSTAKFPTYNHATITKSGNQYTVNGYVDAQNSFGATVRTNFTVVFKKNSESYYTVISVNIYN